MSQILHNSHISPCRFTSGFGGAHYMYHICHIYYIYHIHHRVDLPLALVAHTHTCQADEYRVDTPAAHGSPAPPADPHIPPMLMDVDSLGTFREDKGGYAYLSVVCVCVCVRAITAGRACVRPSRTFPDGVPPRQASLKDRGRGHDVRNLTRRGVDTVRLSSLARANASGAAISNHEPILWVRAVRGTGTQLSMGAKVLMQSRAKL